jgi:hypothetical protein
MRRRLTLIARVVLLFVLATQAVLAAVPCVSIDAKASDAYVAMPEGCDEAPPGNLCLQHCTAFDQTSAHAEMPVLHAPTVLLPVLPYPEAAPSAVTVHAEKVISLALGPPIPIRLGILLL